MTEYIENPLSGKLRGVTYEDGKIIDVHIRDTDDVVKVFVPMASEKEVTGMADMMNFPKRWEDFLHDYEFEDARRIYTNGSRLIPSFRVKQMMEHYAPVRHGRWIDKGEYAVCTECGGRSGTQYDGVESIPLMTQFCPNCGAIMDGGDD